MKDIFNNHSSSLSIEETLFLLTKIYYSIEEYEIAKNYASILAFNFPKSKWYIKSYNLINGLEDVGKDKKWFEKFNPIEIFKQERQKNSNNISIEPIK